MPNSDDMPDPRGAVLEQLAAFLGLDPRPRDEVEETAGFRDLWTRSGLTGAAYAASLAKFLGLELATFESISAFPPLMDAFAPRFLREFGAYPFRDGSGSPVIAIAEPIDPAFDRATQIVLGERPRYVVASYDDIASLVVGRFGENAAEPEAAAEAGAHDDDVESLRDLASGEIGRAHV